LVADLASLDEVQRDRRGHRKLCVEPTDRILHEASVPAVAPHLSHVFAKLNVSSRAELAAAASRRG
jgi:hypothetical protein